MDAEEIPICPSGLSLFLLDSGWAWSHRLLQTAVEWLAEQGITDKQDLVDLSPQDLAGLDSWSEEACMHACGHDRGTFAFLQVQRFWKSLLQVCEPMCIASGRRWHVCPEHEEKETSSPAVHNRRRRRGRVCYAPHARVSQPLLMQHGRRGPSTIEEVTALHARPTTVLNIRGVKPLQALSRLADQLQGDPAKRADWLERSRIAAVLGSCPCSHASFRSGAGQASARSIHAPRRLHAGIQHWLKFILVTHGAQALEQRAFPPVLGDVLSWSNTFQCDTSHRVCAKRPQRMWLQVLRHIRQLSRLLKRRMPCDWRRSAAHRAPCHQEEHGWHSEARAVQRAREDVHKQVRAQLIGARHHVRSAWKDIRIQHGWRRGPRSRRAAPRHAVAI